jgi:hypothetical protein
MLWATAENQILFPDTKDLQLGGIGPVSTVYVQTLFTVTVPLKDMTSFIKLLCSSVLW